MAAELCNEVYDRILPDSKAPVHVLCTYIAGHGARHSWETLRVVDEAEALERQSDLRAAVEDSRIPQALRTLVQGISSGHYDSFLELILAAAHDRKRARRGTLGFGRR